MKIKTKQVNRRKVLSWLAGAGLSMGFGPSQSMMKLSFAQTGELPKFLIVIGCAGGASIIDGVLAQRSSEVGRNDLNSFPDANFILR